MRPLPQTHTWNLNTKKDSENKIWNFLSLSSSERWGRVGWVRLWWSGASELKALSGPDWWNVHQAKSRMLDHLAEFLGRAGPCCFLSLKPEVSQSVLLAIAWRSAPLGCPVLAVLIYQIHTPLGSGHLSLFLNFPLLHSCSSGRTGFFHRQNQCGPDDALVPWITGYCPQF